MNFRATSIPVFLLLLPALLISACAGGSDLHDAQEEDILAAVQIYLRQQRGMNPDSMGMEMIRLELDGNQAQVTIQFTSLDGGDNLEFRYLLSRGDDGWTVDRSQGQSGHGEGSLPPEHPPLPEDRPQDPGRENPPKNS